MRLYFLGNCQMVAMADMFRQRFPEWQIRSLAIYLPATAETVDEHKAEVLAADYVITQWISEEYYNDKELLTLRVSRQRVAIGRPLITVTPVVFSGEMPSFFYLMKDREALTCLGMSYHNVLVPYYICRGWSDRQIIGQLCSESLFTPAFMRNTIRHGIDELRRRDNMHIANSTWTHVPVADVIERQFARGAVMHTFDHPIVDVMVRLCDAVLLALGRPEPFGAAATDYLDQVGLPVLPSVAKAIPCRGPSSLQIKRSDLYDMPEMVARSAAEYRQHLPGPLQDLLFARPGIAAFLREFAAQA